MEQLLTPELLLTVIGIERFEPKPFQLDHFLFFFDENIMYLRPSYEGGFYWGIGIDYCEFYNIKPLKTLDDLTVLHSIITGGKILEINKEFKNVQTTIA